MKIRPAKGERNLCMSKHAAEGVPTFTSFLQQGIMELSDVLEPFQASNPPTGGV